MLSDLRPIVVTGANGLVGARVCAVLSSRGVPVRAIVRREGSAPQLPGVEERVGEFHDRDVALEACRGAAAAIHTVHPMGDDDLQADAVGWAGAFAEAARDAGVPLFVHVSTTSVYEREAETGDVDENSALVLDSANLYSVTKRDTERAIGAVDGMTRVLVRPTAILGNSENSVWNTLRPQDARDSQEGRVDDPDRTFGWVHVRDLAELIVDIATGRIATAAEQQDGPVEGEVTAVNAVSGNVRMRDYLEPVCEAVGVEPRWETRQAFRASLLADRARNWGWNPTMSFDESMAELIGNLRKNG